ncbi:cell wall-active antibiotics response protein LiaF [Alkalibacillus haloalkaliphilus]|uniref:cell wall-active antibiotics response protein LiaF n=1 Tax=Alkalibacillus haloalkaliphilus TaxID=94136 RepID=UPI0002D537E0|nr:cell wall-active antibiotics response protein LiaF [Alkalibacillus haloalkaliphilus]
MFRFLKWLFAVSLIFFGVTLILQNLQIITLEISDAFVGAWPLIFVVLGLMLFVNYFRTTPGGSWFWGLFFLIFGSLLLAGNYGYADFSFRDFWKLWPLILVYIGASLVTEKKTKGIQVYANGARNSNDHRSKVVDKFDDDFFEDSNEYVDFEEEEEVGKKRTGRYIHHVQKGRNFITNLNLSRENWSLEPMDVWAFIGDIYIDFSKAYIPEKETKVVLRGYIGDIVLKVPEHVAVKVYGQASIGDITVFGENRSGMYSSLSYQSDDYKEATRKLNIYVKCQIGDVKVISV